MHCQEKCPGLSHVQHLEGELEGGTSSSGSGVGAATGFTKEMTRSSPISMRMVSIGHALAILMRTEVRSSWGEERAAMAEALLV